MSSGGTVCVAVPRAEKSPTPAIASPTTAPIAHRTNDRVTFTCDAADFTSLKLPPR